VFGLHAVAAATLAGVIVSVTEALGTMPALYEPTRNSLRKTGAIRTVFCLIAFPTGLFPATVPTESLFIGLAFGSLTLLSRKRWLCASLPADCATLTRAVGAADFTHKKKDRLSL
jgi:hypothetical protein